VTLYWRADGSYLAIFVKDSGIGIPKNEQEKIFEPFYRIYHSDYNIEGTGIGLTLVKQNVLEMKGTVGVSSMENIGSTFWIKIPV
jgi:signal transduction histidine kinase